LTPEYCPDSRQLLGQLLDPGSWRSWDGPVAESGHADPSYIRLLADARERTGYDESALTGEGRVAGHRTAIVMTEPSFLGGSLGRVAARRIAAAMKRATDERLPLLAIVASGGIRMQEGAKAFSEMATLSALAMRHRRARLLYVVYLRHPSTGGALASFGSLGHVTMVEPGALVGFVGPRVHEALESGPVPTEARTAECFFRSGLADLLVEPRNLRLTFHRILDVAAPWTLHAPPVDGEGPLPSSEAQGGPPQHVAGGSGVVARSRRADRPGLRELLRVATTDLTLLSGDGEGEIEASVLLALARFGQERCVVVGHDRAVGQGKVHPAGLRVARRGMRLAAELQLPIVTVVDSAGAELTAASELGGLAAEIAHCLSELVFLETPTVSVLLGQGAGGAALALVPADRVLAARNSWLAPLAPEGASALLYRTTEHAAELADLQGAAALSLLNEGIVHRVVPELPDAADEPEAFCRRLGRVIEGEIAALRATEDHARLTARLERYGVA
jgi:acetyl-CoA carboxylase alpha subunit